MQLLLRQRKKVFHGFSPFYLSIYFINESFPSKHFLVAFDPVFCTKMILYLDIY